MLDERWNNISAGIKKAKAPKVAQLSRVLHTSDLKSSSYSWEISDYNEDFEKIKTELKQETSLNIVV